MTGFKWVRKNLVQTGSPLYVYECEDYKVAYDYKAFNPTKIGMEIQINLLRVVHNSEGWEVLKWDWSCVRGCMGYVRLDGCWGYKTKKAAIEDAEYEIRKRIEWDNDK